MGGAFALVSVVRADPDGRRGRLAVDPAMRDLIDARLPRPCWVALAYCNQDEGWLVASDSARFSE